MDDDEITPEEFARIQEEEFGVSPEERARIDAKLSAALDKIRVGQMPIEDLPPIIHEFGEERFQEALPEIVAYLTDSNPPIRYIALHVLTFHFQLKEYKHTAIEMLLHDPDEDCRQQAASGLGALMKNTGDQESLHALAQVIHSEKDDNLIRAITYGSMHGIVHYDRQQQNQLTQTVLKPSFQMDWKFVDQYLGD